MAQSNLEKNHDTETQQKQRPLSEVSPARWEAWQILQRVEGTGAYLDRLVESMLNRRPLGVADRALLAELVHGVVRWQRWLDFVLQHFAAHPLHRYPMPVRAALRLGAYQLLFLSRVPAYAALHQAVELVKPLCPKAAGLVNAILRALLRHRERLPEPDREDKVRYYATVASYPTWIVRRWLERLGEEEAVQLLQAQNRRPQVALRVNQQRIRPEELVEWLRCRGVETSVSEYTQRCILAEHLPHELLREVLQHGWASVQDVSAALVVELAAVRPGMQIVDLCAAPGGKACAMAEQLEGRGHIAAVDVHPNRLRLVEREANRLGVASVMSFHAADARSFRWKAADLVLADVPCSGLGTIAKKPDIKWHRREADIPALVRLQRSILENAARLVRPGGVLLYSTCTTEPEENEGVVQDFLRRHPEFVLEHAEQWIPAAVCQDGFLKVLPHRHPGCDGAFAARMRRVDG
ncbi:MAG: 16S rRNA (cytosine(967)-C(5))-methyltransferase RsmB [Candidatus Kapabacteria bacterium]|nr:16S rRNA (cytosine(967)-C(5))-methyltransferase RsmB [Candidatus Kapabacteria bacterium]MDW8012763.1 16S rRNA (cytosine(967)-C(5))-methyltransferase RsmB [Bacteroidota bacterium]